MQARLCRKDRKKKQKENKSLLKQRPLILHCSTKTYPNFLYFIQQVVVVGTFWKSLFCIFNPFRAAVYTPSCKHEGKIALFLCCDVKDQTFDFENKINKEIN